MKLREAMEIAADCLTVAPLGSLTPQREEAAALLRRAIQFVEAAEQACAAAFTLRIRENGAVTWEMGYEFIDKMEAAYRAMKEGK